MTNQTLKDFSIRSLSSNSSLQSFAIGREVENFGVLTQRARASGDVTKSSSDRYNFTLKKTARVQLTLFNTASSSRIGIFGDTKARVQAELFRNNINLGFTAQIKPQTQESFTRRLKPGDYRVRITGRSKDPIEYSIRLRTV